jgi:hypothetical protein
MSRLVFLLEEYSMKVFLQGLLPRFFPDLSFLCVSHEGKQDLMKSVPKKLRAWREPGVRFVVLRDNDGGDCRALKRTLIELCAEGGPNDALVRIACQELEAWYFGDSEALAVAFARDQLRRVGTKERYRDPDVVVQPGRALAELIPEFHKVSGARRMAAHLARGRNTSSSFNVFLAGVEQLAASLRSAQPDRGAS